MLIATRTLFVKLVDGSDHRTEIRIFQPEKDDADWRCRYEIDWPNGTRVSAGHGVDSAQALFVSMQKIGAELYTSSYHRENRLRFEAPGKGYGFPVPKPMRDLLVGDDLYFEGN